MIDCLIHGSVLYLENGWNTTTFERYNRGVLAKVFLFHTTSNIMESHYFSVSNCSFHNQKWLKKNNPEYCI